jgi:hypothetical protein
MGRAWRIEYEGAIYHLGLAQVNDGQRIYLDDADQNLFLETISEIKAVKSTPLSFDGVVKSPIYCVAAVFQTLGILHVLPRP